MISQYSTKPPAVKLKCLVLGAAAAGKTSLLRRYFYKTFQTDRVPTVGSDWYTMRVPNPLTEDQTDISVSLQMWDTPGRERFDASRQRQQTESLGDSFLKHADAILLVYDATSSTSFKQLLKWYADLLEFRKKKHVPILVVANKLDLLVAEQQQRSPNQHQRVGQRDVLGLQGQFTGHDFRYEYQVSRIEETSSNTHKKDKRMEISSYLADRENWTEDGSYLSSLVTSEDRSNPDRDMVVLWCMRNGLKHMEASAATGEGVEDAFRELMRLALEEKEPQVVQQPVATYQYAYQHNKELDLHQRYGPKDENCCLFIFQALLRLVR